MYCALMYRRSVHTWQVLGSPLYLINKDYYYAYMAVTKQFFGLLVNTITHLFSPTLIRISGDDSVAGQLHVQEDGGLNCDFPHRLILVANHQVSLCPACNLNNMLSLVDLHRLVVYVVGQLHCSYAWSHLHYPQGVSEVDSRDWASHAVLRLHLHGSKLGQGQTPHAAPSSKVEQSSRRANVWGQST